MYKIILCVICGLLMMNLWNSEVIEQWPWAKQRGSTASHMAATAKGLEAQATIKTITADNYLEI